jgi:hypothetical protein
MSKYVPQVRFETEFDGDQISMNLQQLRRGTFMDWMPFLSKMDPETQQLSPADTIELITHASIAVTEYVTDFSGLKDAHGNAVDIKTVCEEVFFMELVSEIIMKLIEISGVGQGKEVREDNEGKSEGQSLELSTV